MEKIKNFSKKIYCFIFGHLWVKSEVYEYKSCLNCGKIKKV